MSTQRNSPTGTSRGRNVAAAIAAVVAPIAATIVACSDDTATGPTAAAHVAAVATAPSSATAPVAPAPKTPKPSAKDSANRESAAQLVVQAATFHTQPGDQEPGTDRPLPMMCGFTGQYTVSQPIGPNGGTVRFGASSLTIPKGALSSTVQIAATITLGQGVTVEFQPHGLQFAKAATIVANYAGCTVPTASPGVNVYYTDASGGITQSMPSSNNATQHVVTSLTDHFSGYAIAWGRY